MLDSAEKRREKIIELINKEGRVKVSELSRIYGISEVTVRSDLEYLESTGSIKRVHGGAIAKDKLYIDMDVAERFTTNAASKKAIAQKLAELIGDDDTIILNSGTTLTYVLRALRGKKNITILTNSIAIATEASSYYGFNVTLLGGLVESKYGFTYGPDSVSQLDKYHAGKCILSVDGVTGSHGLSLYYASEAELINKMISCADTVIVAADSSKIGRNTFARVCPITDVDVLVTSRADNADALSSIRKSGVEVYEA
ncbi:MAG: DeoR/GlpR transcriptional regulator [Clostridia bacterium]|nr:DeoR/GlpR transcriptional regulator [Clostridia bacterium]